MNKFTMRDFMVNFPEELSLQEVANFLPSLDENIVLELIVMGEIPSIQRGGKYYVTQDDFVYWYDNEYSVYGAEAYGASYGVIDDEDGVSIDELLTNITF